MIFVFNKKRALFYASVLVLLVAILALIGNIDTKSVFSIATNNDWGLSYQKNGETPIGNADAAFLKEYNSYYVGDTSKKIIYLTFDAGFENGNTEKILDALKKHNATATFFLVDNYVKTAPDLVKRMVEQGCTVGNHTTTHPDMSKIINQESFEKELNGVEKSYKDIIGKDMPKVYRPPQGKFSEENLKLAHKMGYKTVFWSLAYVDCLEDKQPTKEQAYSKLLTRIHPGAIVLLHSTSKTNADILDELLTKWEEMGYSFGSINDLN